MNAYAKALPKDICVNHIVVTNRKYVCDNCHYAFFASEEDGELLAECPFCNASVACGTLDSSFDA